MLACDTLLMLDALCDALCEMTGLIYINLSSVQKTSTSDVQIKFSPVGYRVSMMHL